MKTSIIILGGKTGLLGQALTSQFSKCGYTVYTPTRNDFSLLNSYQLTAYIDSIQPELIVNAIAYTDVNGAEKKTDEAYAVNSFFCKTLADILYTRPARCITFSTDYLFNGTKEAPYTENDTPSPINVYGNSKLMGERALQERIPEKTLILRTAWLFGHNAKNFVSTIHALSCQKKQLPVITDQIGSPTFTEDLAQTCSTLCSRVHTGVYHVTNSQKASWYELACAAITLTNNKNNIVPMLTKNYQMQAPRPKYSVLSCEKLSSLGICMRTWQHALKDYLSASKYELTNA